MTQTKIHEVLHRASLFLEKANREPKVAEILIRHHLGLSRQEWLLALRDPISEEKQIQIEADIKKHAETGIPVQHLTESEEFYGRIFQVNKHVLIPRPETEELVLAIKDYLAAQTGPVRVVDIGTGSGVIAITLALELNHAEVFATDISAEALQIAKQNADQWEADVSFLEGDFLSPVIHETTPFDVIVSNPPYIAKSEAAALSDTVRDFDPELALFAEEDGLAAYHMIIEQVKQLPLKKDTLLAFEIGHTQGESVKKRIQQVFPGSHVEIKQDINGKDRMVFASHLN
ncbi:release factor glutamine methyltransferase [Oceanobacillus oncorhynchi subsp. incaldanensis]|uniref:Release factor glutamine methyltransferase n=1 Tax=Oceanobacillus aidingensis TaxID=645964 RepID=A0ABV9JUC5_9BACI|nr:peptide chain release factor N(5)-glutamine methyltransferase [Oceanobacillus oncorhynchi]MDM8102749.1 peptide chain release factor N(5)-glutamine methyltransferase [Oceanobacillus oncorhynchi]UUI39625.1 peptide chain release factor N(5)-glutamine methyltransferase [Oceanobacillus oncorhynchi]GIO19032.1 release factor glutamine methyltransferase [Oceanobacillus oncorhynchi subsp. incaldanensis]